jgi:hypothetical protein
VKGHGDIVVERGFVVSVAQVAMEVVLNSTQRLQKFATTSEHSGQ